MVEPEAYAMQTSCNSHPTHNLRPVCLAVVVILFIAMTQAQSAPAQKTNTQPAGSRGTAAQNTKQESGRPEAPSVLAQLNNDLESLAAKVSPAVVQILVTGYGPLREEDKSQTALIVRQHAVGSGVIVDSNGYIMTNAHVVEGAQRIRVALPLPMGDSAGQVPLGKRRILEAKLLGQHKETDLALLKIEDSGLPSLSLLTQQRPRVGQLVFAIGSPEGLQNSVTMGVVS